MIVEIDLQLAKPYDLGMPLCSAPAFFGVFYTIYVRGEAVLGAHQGTEAAAEFRKFSITAQSLSAIP